MVVVQIKPWSALYEGVTMLCQKKDGMDEEHIKNKTKRTRKIMKTYRCLHCRFLERKPETAIVSWGEAALLQALAYSPRLRGNIPHSLHHFNKEYIIESKSQYIFPHPLVVPEQLFKAVIAEAG